MSLWELQPGDSIEQKVTPNQLLAIDQLLKTSTISDKNKDSIEQWKYSLSFNEAMDLIEHLQENQLPDDPRYNDQINKTKLYKFLRTL